MPAGSPALRSSRRHSPLPPLNTSARLLPYPTEASSSRMLTRLVRPPDFTPPYPMARLHSRLS
ncbi:hypothetical protein K438DRAFT_1821764 [Mycena galopus ATCC 62051]|nr:hypothetical protein K438DRAFT_1821764 [Mycena galopus ATCC 62051]